MCIDMPGGNRAPWYQPYFALHPLYASGAREAWTVTSGSVHGKRKVWCWRCLEKRIGNIVADEMLQVFLGTMHAVRTRDTIVDEREYLSNTMNNLLNSYCVVWSLPEQSAGWIAYRESNCLVHLRGCKEQPEDIRMRARLEQESVNTARRMRHRDRSGESLAGSVTAAHQPASDAAIANYMPDEHWQSTSAPGALTGTVQDASFVMLEPSPYPSVHGGLVWNGIDPCSFAAPYDGLQCASTSSSSVPGHGRSIDHDVWYSGSASVIVSHIHHPAPASLMSVPARIRGRSCWR